ncbi:MAG: glycosyltransferase family 9 protein [Kiritimatiellae bacterium]|nr:glycosyltransferase family 9 protein [Kiritimatiellia bacterium]
MVNVNLLRFIDRFAGVPLCLLLTLVRYLAYPFWRNSTLPSPKNILIIKLSEMGSTVLAYPAVEEIREQVPKAQIFSLVFRNNRAIIDALKLTRSDNIITVDAGSITNLISSGWNAFWRLKRENIDTTIDMDFFSRFSAIFAFLVCRGNRVGFHRFTNEGLNRGKLLTHEVIYSAHVHTSVAFMVLVRALFYPDATDIKGREMINEHEFRVPEYFPDPYDMEKLRNKLKETGLDIGRKNMCIVLVNPNSSDLFPLRRWPLGNFISLSSKLLSSRNDIYIAITGVESERQDAEVIMNTVQSPRCINLVGKTTFQELLALYSISSLMVTNDRGPAHFAVLTRLPTVVLFGPETPALYAPLGGKAKNLYAGFVCSPCVSVNNAKASPCDRSYCLEAISVDQVLQCSMKILDDTAVINKSID